MPSGWALGAAVVALSACAFCSFSLQGHRIAVAANTLAGAPRRVTILGGGIGGLVAAHRLQRQGFAVTILEARHRTGGRVWTHTGWGHPIDVGATFIHGVDDNPLAALAREFGQPLLKVDYSRVAVYGSDGTQISKEELKRSKAAYRALRKEVMRTRDRLWRDTDMGASFQAAWAKLYGGGAKSKQAGGGGGSAPATTDATSDSLPPGVTPDAMSWQFFWEIVQDQIAELGDLSTVEFDASTAYDGHDYILGQGMQGLTDALTESFAAMGGEVVINATATGVRRNPVGGFSVDAQVAGRDVQFSSEQVIVALPLGVMKAGVVSFDPPLPKWKRRSIHRLGCSAALKMALRFDRVFWDDTLQFIGKVSSENQTLWGGGAHIEFINMNRFHPGSNVLILEVDVGHARHVAELTPEGRVAHIMSALRQVYGEGVPDPVDTRTANFVGDPLIRCGFSYWPPFVSGDDNLECAAPLHGGSLHFIGEYTTPTGYGNLHGAIEEGERVAAEMGGAAVWETLAAPLRAVLSGGGREKKRFTPQWCPSPCQMK